jgi:hypothetical protein
MDQVVSSEDAEVRILLTFEIGNLPVLAHPPRARALPRRAAEEGSGAARQPVEAARVVDGVLAALPDETLRASLEALALVREVRARLRAT